MKFKNEFIDKYSKLTNFKEYEKAISQHPKKSLRVNTLKSTVKKVKEALEKRGYPLQPIPWCKEGFYFKAKKRQAIGNLMEHWKGLFYVQSSLSMLPPLILNPSEKDKVLDMCASPGSKTSQLASMMNNKGIIVANDLEEHRIRLLKITLQRLGVMNTVVTKMDGRRIKEKFDKILLDSPCSGTGIIMGSSQRSETSKESWSENRIKNYSKLQKQLAKNAFSLLKEGGTLIYSTCSLDPEEDEEVVEYLETLGAKTQPINITLKGKTKKWVKIWPQDYEVGGFFISKLKK